MNTFKDAIDALLPAAGTRPVTDAHVPVRDSPSPRPYRLLHHPYHLPAAAPCPLSASWAARWAAAAATKVRWVAAAAVPRTTPPCWRLLLRDSSSRSRRIERDSNSIALIDLFLLSALLLSSLVIFLACFLCNERRLAVAKQASSFFISQ
ncbi:Os03g0102850 [Oryza sativa Japonica Group]|uniref:Os03g0102850 protein n=1 Tax=Oryza sativa subsp. japonica TaxID=39947 RepID=A0A0N7KGF1_ORYSJ|nr:Os03g0102850 [Oryza sativa Japonica Group]